MRVLLLAGTGEAVRLADALARAGHQVTASLAGATRTASPLAVDTRVGGFGGRAGFLDWLDTNGPDLVIDATHPFAQRISARSAQLCEEVGVPYVQLLRPPWVPDATKSQYQVATVAAAREYVSPGARVFLATGRQTLREFGSFSDCYLICRQIDPPDGPFPYPNGEFLIGRPPFSVADERALFSKLMIDWLIVKNAGGAASFSKIEAAAELGIPVLMLERPAQQSAHQIATVEDVMDWVEAFADH